MGIVTGEHDEKAEGGSSEENSKKQTGLLAGFRKKISRHLVEEETRQRTNK